MGYCSLFVAGSPEPYDDNGNSPTLFNNNPLTSMMATGENGKATQYGNIVMEVAGMNTIYMEVILDSAYIKSTIILRIIFSDFK